MGEDKNWDFKQLAKRVVLVVLILILIQAATFQKPSTKRPDIRGIWVTRSTLTSKESILEMLEDIERANLTDIFAQVNMSGYAYYQSTRLPPAVTTFDPLEFLLEEAEKRDIRVHAWLNAFTVGPLGSPPEDSRHVLFQHPDWSTVDIRGVSVLEYPRSKASEALPTQYLEPGLREVQEWVIENCLEVISKYKVAGIHLDFLRYPGQEFGYHPKVLERFEKQYGVLYLGFESSGDPKVEEAFNEFRREQISYIIKSIYEGTKKLQKDTLVSVAVYSDPIESLNEKFQDWFKWLSSDYVDFVCPMVYSIDHTVFQSELNGIAEKDVELSKVAVGLGAYQDSKEEVLRKTLTVKEEGFAGFVLFSYDAIKGAGMFDVLSQEIE